MVYLSNAFSLGMLKGDAVLRVQQIPLEEAVKILSSGFTSAVGHQSTAKVIEEIEKLPFQFFTVEVVE